MKSSHTSASGSTKQNLEVSSNFCFGQIVGITGLILTKLDGSARGGCVVNPL